jgi:hypothetical protein
MRRLKLLLSVAALICSLSVLAANNPFLGTWKVDLTKSKASNMPSANLTVLIEPNGEDGVRISEDYVGTMNTPRHVTRACKFDGKDYPVTGWTQPAGTEAIRRMDSRTWEVTRKSEGKVIERYHAVVSSDGNTLTEAGTHISPAGEKREFSVVYVRR